jgi:pantothenate kinase
MTALPDHFRARIDSLLASGTRRVLGIVGPPGAGKSTLAQMLRDAWPGVVQVVPMDGFHLANAELARLGRAQRKGAPDTFDAAGFVALLRRLREQRVGDEIVYAPEFRREIEEPVAGAIAVLPATRMVVTEGNYLLMDEAPWGQIDGLLDDSWYVEIAPALRRERLLARHVQFGRNAAAAEEWMRSTDEPNAQRIEATKHRARAIVRWDEA